MNRDDVELVVSKVVEFLKPSLKEKISLVEIFDISQSIFQDIQFEKNEEDESVTYCLSRDDIEKILKYGDLEIAYEDGKRITFVLQEDGLNIMTFESGDALMWYDGDEE